jgi:hypothetical protein
VKKVITENETIIYPFLEETDEEVDDEYCIVVGNGMTLIDGRIIEEDAIAELIKGLEAAQDVIDAASSSYLTRDA